MDCGCSELYLLSVCLATVSCLIIVVALLVNVPRAAESLSSGRSITPSMTLHPVCVVYEAFLC